MQGKIHNKKEWEDHEKVTPNLKIHLNNPIGVDP